MVTTPSIITLRITAGMAIAALALAVVSDALAQEAPPKSPMAKLTQAPPGRVIFDFGSKPKAAGSAVGNSVPASSIAAAAPAGSATTQSATDKAQSTSSATPPSVAPSAATAVPAKEAAFNFLGNLPPPSGRSLNDARRLDAPDQGIVIKDAPKATK